MIQPTNGRIVLFTPVEGDLRFNRLNAEPMSAMVVHVWDNRRVNLSVFDHVGIQRSMLNVTLLQDDDAKPLNGPFCEWMPYQKGQAARHDAGALLGNGAIAGGGPGYKAPASDPA